MSMYRHGKRAVPPSRTRVVGYVRASTDEQQITLEAQREKIHQYCALHDLELVGVFVDAGASAKSLDRPELPKALALLRSGKADGLVVTKLDRLTRSVRDMGTLIDDHFGEHAGSKLMSIGESIDTRTAVGLLMLNLITSIAQWERQTIGERTREALGHLKRQGIALGTRNPRCPGASREDALRGSRASAEARSAAAREDDSLVLPRILELRSQGETLGSIARTLDAEGLCTRGEATWTHTQVRRILARNVTPATP